MSDPIIPAVLDKAGCALVNAQAQLPYDAAGLRALGLPEWRPAAIAQRVIEAAAIEARTAMREKQSRPTERKEGI